MCTGWWGSGRTVGWRGWPQPKKDRPHKYLETPAENLFSQRNQNKPKCSITHLLVNMVLVCYTFQCLFANGTDIYWWVHCSQWINAEHIVCKESANTSKLIGLIEHFLIELTTNHLWSHRLHSRLNFGLKGRSLKAYKGTVKAAQQHGEPQIQNDFINL